MRKLWASFGFALQGIGTLFRTQPNARIHGLAGVVVLGLGWGFHVAVWEWLALVIVIGLVLICEAMNTALEFLADAVTRDRHPLIGQAKDCGAGATLIASLTAVVVGGIVFGPRFCQFLQF